MKFLILTMLACLAAFPVACQCERTDVPRTAQYRCPCARPLDVEAMQKLYTPSAPSDQVVPEAGSIYGYCSCLRGDTTGINPASAE